MVMFVLFFYLFFLKEMGHARKLCGANVDQAIMWVAVKGILSAGPD